jgi:ABC-type multidrug transport system fused ATPase/permease subunit
MSQADLRRAQNLMVSRAGSVAAIHTLAVIQALLIFALFGIVGLLVGLTSTRGVSQITEPFVERVGLKRLPDWLVAHLPAFEAAAGPNAQSRRAWNVSVPDTGLEALVISGLSSELSTHRFLAGLLEPVVRSVRWLGDTQGALITLLIAGLALILVLSVVVRVRRRLAVDAVTRATTGLRHQLHRQMYRLGQSALPGEGLGPVVNIFSRDVNEVRDGLYANLVHGVFNPLLVIGLLLMAFLLSPSLTVFVISLTGIVWLASVPLERVRRGEIDSAARSAAIYLLQLHEDLSMLRTVRVFGMEAVDKQRFDEHLHHYQAADRQRLLSDVNRNPALVLLATAAALLVIGMLGHAVLNGHVSAHSAVLLVAALAGLVWPLDTWLRLRKRITLGQRAARGVFEFLERKPELQMNVGARFLPPLRERIVLDKVTIEGPTGRTLLSGVSATIAARTRTAILGFDEDAKHAVACLIPRLIDPKSGQIRVDGHDLREVTLESLRAQVSMVLQADYVFSDSVLNNIGLGDPSYTLPRIIEAAKVAHAHHFIQELPNGYDTVVGQLGHPLRLDEQYRVALARAYLHDPSIVIVEEPDTVFDEDTKHLFDDTIDRLAKGRTLIFLPHRLSTIRKCDQVIVLHNGRIEAAGATREVHERSKLYRHIQYVEFNQFASGEIEAGQMS